jgi:hypothetical protein
MCLDIFVLLDIEKVRIVSGITATNPLDLYHMRYTHMLWLVFQDQYFSGPAAPVRKH